MSRTTSFESVLLTLNTVGFLGYLFWLVFRADSFMYSQEGVLYLLPCLPFFFVYVYVFQRRRAEEEEGGSEEETH